METLQILEPLMLLLSSVITLIRLISAIKSSDRLLVVSYTALRRGPAMVFRVGGLYAGFNDFRNILPAAFSNILKGWLPRKHHIAASISRSFFFWTVRVGKFIWV